MALKKETARSGMTRRTPKCVDAEELNISELKTANTNSQESGWIKLGDAADILVARLGGEP